MAIHSSIFAWRIPWTKKPGRLQSMGVTKSRKRANFLSWSFIGLPHKPSYSASFFHWIFLLSYPHSITLYIFDEYVNSRQRRLPFEYPGSGSSPGTCSPHPSLNITSSSSGNLYPCCIFLTQPVPLLAGWRVSPFICQGNCGHSSIKTCNPL